MICAGNKKEQVKKEQTGKQHFSTGCVLTFVRFAKLVKQPATERLNQDFKQRFVSKTKLNKILIKVFLKILNT